MRCLPAARLFGGFAREGMSLHGSPFGRTVDEGHDDDWHLGKENSKSVLANPLYRAELTPIGAPLK